jgi:hypothetical protein
MVRVAGNFDGSIKRTEAIRLNLSQPEPFLEEQAKQLSEMVMSLAPVNTGLLKSAFEYTRLYKTGRGSGIGIGDPSILTKPSGAEPGFIKEFVKWLREQNAKASGKYQKGQAKVRAERTTLLEKRRSIRKSEAKGRKPSNRIERKSIRTARIGEIHSALSGLKSEFSSLWSEYKKTLKYSTKVPYKLKDLRTELHINIQDQREWARELKRATLAARKKR